jgi:ankyrin repeat protein
LPETHEAEHGFEVSRQNTPSRSELDAINQQDILGRTLLHRMVTTGELNNVKDALVNGARVDVEDNDGNQPLHLAVIGNYPHIIRYLLKYGARLNAQGSDGKTPVHLALGLPAALRALLAANPNLSISDNDGDTALHVALRRVPSKIPRDGGVIEKLLRRGANVNAMNHAGVTPFHMVMKKPEYCHSSLFLEHDPDINLLTHAGESSFAIFLTNIGTRKHAWSHQTLMFLQKGADPNTQVSGGESLIYAMLDKSIGLHIPELDDVALQLCKTANIHTPSVTGDFPLHCVMRSWVSYLEVDQTHLKLAKALLYRGSDPNQSNGKGKRPIQALLSNDVVSSLRLFRSVKIALINLLDHGADPMLVDSSGDLPICIAYRQMKNDSRDEVVKILTDAFIARPENSDEGNKTPPIPVWWSKYRAFRLQNHWTSEATQLFEAASSGVATGIPQDLTEKLPKLLISFAAKAILQAAETRLSIEGHGMHAVLESYNVVSILRDCKNMGIDMDTKWYHFLLDNLP